MNSKPTVESVTSFLSLESEAAAHDVSLPSSPRVALPAAVPILTVFAPAPVVSLPITTSLLTVNV